MVGVSAGPNSSSSSSPQRSQRATITSSMTNSSTSAPENVIPQIVHYRRQRAKTQCVNRQLPPLTRTIVFSAVDRNLRINEGLAIGAESIDRRPLSATVKERYIQRTN